MIARSVVAVACVSLLASGCGHSTTAAPCGVLNVNECKVFGSDIVPRKLGSFGLSNLTTIKADVPTGVALRVTYPAHSSSPTSHRRYDNPTGGAQVYLPFRTGSVDEQWLAYQVKFRKGFDFVRGGKMPGFYGGSMTSGGKIPDGTNGLSTRLMWRTAGAGEVYAYLPSSVTYGTEFGKGNWTWPTNVWVKIQQHVKLNTPGKKDGSIRVYINGRQTLDQEDLVFRTTKTLQIEGVFFSTFYGGDDPTWGPKHTQHADFAAFQVSPTRPEE